MKQILSVFLFLLIFIPCTAVAAVPECLSAAYVVMDSKTGQVLVGKEMNTKNYPASITKIMTAALALEHKQLTDTHIMSEEAVFSVERSSSHIALTHGEEVTVEQLVYATMLPSANDAANGLAECVGGTIDKFIDMMNEKAKEVGAVNTNFANANGLPNENHYVTAKDMALITRYALSVPGFREVFGEIQYTMAPTNKQPQSRNFGTEHSMIAPSMYYYEGATGGKLGWTNPSAFTSVTVADRNGIELICVALKTNGKYDKYKDSKLLFDYCFDEFNKVSIPSAKLSFEVPIFEDENQVGNVKISSKEDISIMLHSSVFADNIKFQNNIPEKYIQGDDINPKVSMSVDSSAMTSEILEVPLECMFDEIVNAPLNNVPKATGQEIFSKTWYIVLIVAAIQLLLTIRHKNAAKYRRAKRQRLSYNSENKH